MRVLFDTDIVLDLVLDRDPFADAAAELFELHEQGRVSAYVSGVTLVNVFYVTRKIKGLDGARRAVGELLSALSVCPSINSSLRLPTGLLSPTTKTRCSTRARRRAGWTRLSRAISTTTRTQPYPSTLRPKSLIA